ncbi:MAG: tetratricopeptide repeat protein [Verrucomicrobiota bacterium]
MSHNANLRQGARTPPSASTVSNLILRKGAFALLCLVGYAAPVAAEDQGVPSIYSTELGRAWQCYTNSDYTNSLTHYQAAIQAAPQSLDARLGCLVSLLALNRFAEAEALAARILKQYPANYFANLRLAYALRMQGKHEQAEAVLNHALPLYPTDVFLLLELAFVKLARKQNATAQYLFLDVLTLAPDNAVALQQLAAPQFRLSPPRDEPLAPSAPARKVRVEAAAFYGYLQYHDTASKDQAHTVGLYTSLGYGSEHLLQAEGDYIRKFYRGVSSLRQWDTTLAYANASIPHVNLRLGGHYITSEDPFTDQGWVAFGGAEYYADRWAFGVDGYYTTYPKFQNQLEVTQIAPHLGVTLWRGEHHTWNNELRGYWVHLNRDNFARRNCYSLEDRLSLNWQRWTFSAFGWAGEQLFAVRNGGFAVYNLGELHKAGYGLEIRYDLTANLALTLRANREQFKDLARTPHACSDMYLAMLSWKF